VVLLVLLIVAVPSLAAAQHQHCASKKQHGDDGFDDPAWCQTQRTACGDCDDHVQRKRCGHPGEHSTRPVSRAQHQAGERSLIRQLGDEDDAKTAASRLKFTAGLPPSHAVRDRSCSHTIS
jgi:hypothetical protein